MTQTLLVVALLGLLPFLLLATTSFAKLSIVIGLLRNALGAGQVPSGAIVIVFAALLTGYAMWPVAREVVEAAGPQLAQVDLNAPFAGASGKALASAFELGKEPVRRFLVRNAGNSEKKLFSDLLRPRLPENERAELKPDDLAVALPAFFVTELTEALHMGFLLLLPFWVLDLVIASILASLGMQALSPATVSLPFKLLLFVSVDGFRLLAEALLRGYS